METIRRADLWYVWFPDGRVLRAAGIAAVRQQIEAGRLPTGTRARRSGEEVWRPIEACREFADLAPNGDGAATPPPPATIASRIDPAHFRLIGVRAYLDELYAALDSSLVRAKVATGAAAGVALGALAGASAFFDAPFAMTPPGWGWGLALGAAVVLATLAAILSNLTFVELSRLRPARWREGLPGAPALALRLSLAWVLCGTVVGGLIATLRWLPGAWLAAGEAEAGMGPLAHAAVALGSLAELALWPLFILILALAPILAVEQCSLPRALALWARMLWSRGARLLFANALALAVGLLLTAPIVLLLGLAFPADHPEPLAQTAALIRAVAFGLASGLLLTFLVVANLFIYLHLRQDAPAVSRATARRR